MKALSTALLTLALATHAFAADRTISLLRMDLDLDGQPDLLRVVEGPRAGRPEVTDRRVEVRTAKGVRAIFTGLLRPVTYKGPQNSPCHTGIEEGGIELQGGNDVSVSLRRTGEASFVVTEEYEDQGCSYYGKREFQASLADDGKFPLERAHRLVGHHGMGSGYYARADFDFQYFYGEEELMDRTGDGENASHKWEFPKSCTADLSAISDQKIPACAEYRK